MTAAVRRILIGGGAAAVVYGVLVVIGAVEAWSFGDLPHGTMCIFGGFAGMKIGEIL